MGFPWPGLMNWWMIDGRPGIVCERIYGESIMERFDQAGAGASSKLR